MTKHEKLLEYHKDISNIEYVLNILNWSLRIDTPKKAQNDLLNIITYNENKLFDLTTSKEYEKLLIDTINSKEFKELDLDEQRYITNLYNSYTKLEKIPKDFYTEYQELKNKANIIWKQAKENDDYEAFKPYLEKIIEKTKQYYRYIDPKSKNLYDTMLNEYEIGITSEKIDKLFNEIKEFLIPFIKKINSKNIKEYNIDYKEEELMNIAKYLLNYIGFDIEKGALGIYPHGYTTKIGPNDIRIAFKKSTNPIEFVTTIIHEGGHGIFEQNIKPNLSRYENVEINNLFALHESQSRFYENVLGRNINFWIPIYKEISKQLKIDIPLEEFVNMLNTVSESLIRTEADEVTYPLHIIIRYEIEKDLFNDKIKIDDLPEIWNKKMKEYLNVEVNKDSLGLMQDVHWSEGSFGYFPSYLLGTIYDGIFLEIIEENLGNIDELLRNGEILKITNYLIKNIYKSGGAFTFDEIIKKISNKELSSKPIINYFKNKYEKNT